MLVICVYFNLSVYLLLICDISVRCTLIFLREYNTTKSLGQHKQNRISLHPPCLESVGIITLSKNVK